MDTTAQQDFRRDQAEPARRRRSLRATLALCLAGLQFVAVLSVTLSTFVSSENALLRQSRISLNEVSVNVIGQVKNFLNPARQVLDATRRLAENDVLDINDIAALESHFFQQLQVAPQLAGIYLADDTGRFVYVMRTEEPGRYRTKVIPPFAPEITEHPADFQWRNDRFTLLDTAETQTDTYEARTRPWFRLVDAAKAPIWTQPYIFYTTRQPGITYGVPVLDDAGEIRAILGVDIQIDALSGFLLDIWSEQRGAALVLNEDGSVLAHPTLVLIEKDADFNNPELPMVDKIDDPLAQQAFGALAQIGKTKVEGPVHSDFEVDGQDYVAMLIEVTEPGLRWLIGLYAAEDNFIGEIKKNRVQGIWIALSIAILTGAIGLALADRIYAPVRTFASQTQRLSSGEITAQEGLHSPYRELEDTGAALTQEVRQRQRFETAYGRTFDLASRGMAQISPETGRFQRVNEQLCDIMGYQPGELEKMTLADILPDDGQQIAVKFRETLLQDSEFIAENQFNRKDRSSTWLRVNAILIRDENGVPDHAVAIVDDVSEQKQAEAEASRLNRDLSHVARVNLMGEMASGLAHELNQPLSAISYNVDAAKITLEEIGNPEPELTEILSDIDRQSRRAGDIIRALREVVRKDRGRQTPFELGGLIGQTVSLMESEAKVHNIRLVYNEATQPPVIGNRTQIAQVLVNLLRNAIDALARDSDEIGQITITTQVAEGHIEVQVKDNGPGVSADVTLFNTFDTQKSDGMGLGLSICRTIVKANGGRIWHDPTEAIGACFCFTLRRSDQAENNT
ncbi:ATP-binding protein [uncultured Ruegeria sp.]|uniref:ATP-binding protein n=1 Tax=uncultured Ruegeria sp. TaxID=259304 RepID=UPI00260BB810|nr:ATP-binding protein [uncultured Ruegeria sp.]